MATFGATTMALRNPAWRVPADLPVSRRPIPGWSGGQVSDPKRTLGGAGSNAGPCQILFSNGSRGGGSFLSDIDACWGVCVLCVLMRHLMGSAGCRAPADTAYHPYWVVPVGYYGRG